MEPSVYIHLLVVGSRYKVRFIDEGYAVYGSPEIKNIKNRRLHWTSLDNKLLHILESNIS